MSYIGMVSCGSLVPDNTVVEIPAHDLVLNSKEINSNGVVGGYSNIIIKRGPTLPAAIIRFNELNDKFEIGFSGREFREIENSLWKFIDTDTLLEKNTNYFVDVSDLSTINLILPPNPSTGDSVRLVDVAGKFCEKNAYLRRNDKKIMAAADDVKLSGMPSFDLVYSNENYGWRFV